MASSSQQIPSLVQSWSPTPDVVLSVTTTPSKLVKVCDNIHVCVCFPLTRLYPPKIARQFQLEKNTARTESQALRRKLANITNQTDEDAEAPPTKRTRANGDLDDSTNEETQVVNAGHKFVMVYSLWLRLGEDMFKIDFNPDINDAERFENIENKDQGQLHEIRKVLGWQLANDVSSETWIAKAVSRNICCISQF